MDKEDRELLIRIDQRLEDKIKRDEKNFEILFKFHNDLLSPTVSDVRWIKKIGGVIFVAVSGLVGKVIYEIFPK